MRIEDKYTKMGYFWLPEEPENKIPGVLTIRDGGEIELKVTGLSGDALITGDDDLGRIVGQVEKDGPVTLDDCFWTERNMEFGGIYKSKIHVNIMFSGVAYDKDEEVTFDTFSFSIDGMDEWIQTSGIKVDNDYETRATTIRYNPPESSLYVLENGMNLEIDYAGTLPGFPNIKGATVTQYVYFRLRSENLRPLSDFTQVAHRVTTLLCLAIDDTVSIKKLSATSREIQEDGRDGKTYPVPIRIYYCSEPFSEKTPVLNLHKTLFTFKAIKENAQDVINNWISAYEKLAPALNLYFLARTGAQKYLEGVFLALVQGLETYHRRTSDAKLMDESQFDSLLDTIKKGCPKDNIEWLEGRLKYGNEINLGKRIERIIEPFGDYIGNRDERSKLVRKIVDTRNYLTHYSAELKNKAANGEDLWPLCRKLEAIFQLHLLRVIGFTDEEIVKVIENCAHLKSKLSERI